MGKLGPYEEMIMNETLGMHQFFSCFIVGQFGEIVIAKINFDKAVTMSNEQYC